MSHTQQEKLIILRALLTAIREDVRQGAEVGSFAEAVELAHEYSWALQGEGE